MKSTWQDSVLIACMRSRRLGYVGLYGALESVMFRIGVIRGCLSDFDLSFGGITSN